jgi:hypothetical protein
MSRDWDDESPRRRRRRYDDLDLRRQEAQYSGAVTGAGVFTIVLGGLSLFCFLCTGMAGLFMVGIGEMARQQGNMLPGMFAATGGVILLFALLYLIVGICYLIAGIVTLQRRHWGRVFTLIMGGISVLLGIGQVVLSILGFLDMDPFMPGGGGEGDQVVGAVTNMFAGLIYFAHAGVVFVTLLNSYNIAEFE